MLFRSGQFRCGCMEITIRRVVFNLGISSGNSKVTLANGRGRCLESGPELTQERSMQAVHSTHLSFYPLCPSSSESYNATHSFSSLRETTYVTRGSFLELHACSTTIATVTPSFRFPCCANRGRLETREPRPFQICTPPTPAALREAPISGIRLHRPPHICHTL